MEQHIRRLRLNHVANVRDLGGYEADGGMIRWNMLYRAGDLSGADEGDWERLKAAGVRTILDLRSASSYGNLMMATHYNQNVLLIWQ